MKCPRCVQRIHRAASICPHCSFSLGDADELYGDGEVKLRSLTDAAGIFRKQERERLEKVMARIGAEFPQIFVAVYTGTLGELGNMRQFGFWLLNRGIFEDVPAEKPNEAGVLFVIDPETKAAGLSFGYLLDPFLEERDTFDCLSRGHSYWLEERYADGLLKAFSYFEKLLKKRSSQARRDPEKYERKVSRPVRVEDLVKKIRCGNVQKSAPQAVVKEEAEC